MDKYQRPSSGPPLNATELLIYDALHNLKSAQVAYQVQNAVGLGPKSSRWSFLKIMLLSLFRSHERTKEVISQRVQEEHDQWTADPTRVQAWHDEPMLPPLPLAELWPQIKPPRKIKPKRFEQNDIWFADYCISFRYDSSAEGFTFWYFISVPIGDVPLRCLCLECSGRMFATENRRTGHQPPGPSNFRLLQLKAKGFDEMGELTRDCVMELYLPTLDGTVTWRQLQSEDDSPEEILAFDTAE